MDYNTNTIHSNRGNVVSVMRIVAGLVLGCWFAGTGLTARAQPPSTEAVSAFDADFFSRAQPSTAWDMIQFLPGFRVQEGNAELRGYSGASGNVLIDGRRPANKDETLETLLERIPASAVERIEIIRSGAAGYDMQGQPLLANVVRRQTGRRSGRLEVEGARFRHGYGGGRVAGGLNLQHGEQALDLQAAIYREIDDEHGFGSRNRYAENGELLRLDAYGQPEGVNHRDLAAAWVSPLAGGSLRVGGLFRDSRKFADILHQITLPEVARIDGTERKNTRVAAGETRWDRPFGDGMALELLASRRNTRIRAADTSREGVHDELSREASDAAETILRGLVRRQGERLTLEAGAEGTLNVFDSRVALLEDGVNVPLPAASVRVEERRREIFVTGTWKLAAAWMLEAGLRHEASRLSQSGDSALEKSLSYLKPRLLATWAPSARDQVRLLVEREVGQLDFADFASEASLTSGTITSGNRDLEPDNLWRTELAWEHHVGAGSLVLTGRQERIRDVIDRIAVVSPEGVFDSVGNIGDGSRREIQLDANLPLDGAGLPGFTLRASALARHSRVRDPQTGVRRVISDDVPREASLSLSHDLPARGLRWGVNYASSTTESEFKIGEMQRDRLSVRVDAFVEYKPDARWTIRAFGKNLTNSPAVRSRWIYTGLRADDSLRYREERILRSGPYFGLNVQRRFGE